ncbi:MAG: serine/threonine-protein kinase [Gemmatimonadales bacterium]
MALIEELRAAVGDHYELEGEIGRGATSVVYRAQDLLTGRPVAIKVLDPAVTMSLARERFRREIEITSHLNHPNIVAILACALAKDSLYYVMEFVEGESLRAKLEREDRLEIVDALDIARQVGSALSFAHEAGVIHRDIKPENVLLSGGRALVTDFGVARAIREARTDVLTRPGMALGTPHYMSPEQARGSRRLDGRTDVYSLGCVSYEMLTGTPPFPAEDEYTIMARRVKDPPPPVRLLRAEVPQHVEDALLTAMATLPKRRYAAAAQFVEALQPAES